jgi:hypothetical protein
VARPSGARPQPPNTRNGSDKAPYTTLADEPAVTSPTGAPRSMSSLSHRRAQSSLSAYSSVNSRTDRWSVQNQDTGSSAKDGLQDTARAPLKPSEVVPSATYIERGQRWMEKEEAVALREAMEDMDLMQEEEMRIRAAAQADASELVWQHQHPEDAVKPDAPYRYKDHLKKNSYAHARTQSVGRYGGFVMATGLARDSPRSVSGGSSNSGGGHSQRGRVSSGSPEYSEPPLKPDSDIDTRGSLDYSREASQQVSLRKSYGDISNSGKAHGSWRRRSSAKRNISGEIAGSFTGEQIWEEPEQDNTMRGHRVEEQGLPAPLRIKPRNPLNRVQFAQDVILRTTSTPPEATKKLSASEIHRNPPSQTRNPTYTSNVPPTPKFAVPKQSSERETKLEGPMKDGLEIRSDEIRQATSMRLKDRSPKLPTPTAVSSKLGRPIVSFDKDWKPKEADVKPDERKGPIYSNTCADSQKESLSTSSDSQSFSASIPTINFHNTPPISVNGGFSISRPSSKSPASMSTNPSINIPETPTISIPVSSEGEPSGIRPSTNSQRPLPDPKKAAGHPPRNNSAGPFTRGHWSPAAGKRATATCHQCQLPIEGRVVALRGAPERFHPQCFICFTCGTGLEALEISPEPPAKRDERLDRIRRRACGEELPEGEGQTMADDGDERVRFYCHLDWHENFAPRCKHCKTSIIGEHTVALGEHWHFGHFFCAECGDPFEKGMSHIEKDGYAWCLRCQTMRTERQAPKCKKCRQPVIGEVVQAMGGEWHERCFRCATCKGGFHDGSFFPKGLGDETVVVCTRCMEMELKA